MTSRSTRLRALLTSHEPEFLMEAHNGLSARIVAEAGFAGIWASGLTMSAQYGLRDNNEASWTQVLDVVEFMADSADLPILLDGDSGFGNFNNVRRLVRKAEQRGAAGVCLEDKEFPKTNSFIRSEHQKLAGVDEFCGKLQAARDATPDDDFVLVARTEALIIGQSMAEALGRAEAYRAAGADAILIHSKRPDAGEIVEFAREWSGRSPLVVVPTTYSSTPVEVFRAAGVDVVIWANHMLRAAIATMQRVAGEVRSAQSPITVEDRIVPVSEVFRLQDAAELIRAEERYLPTGPHAVILPASPLKDRPDGESVDGLVDTLRRHGLHDPLVVGPAAGAGELGRLRQAEGYADGDVLVAYRGLEVRDQVLTELLHTAGDVVIVVDSSDREPLRDAVTCSAPDDRGVRTREVDLAGFQAGHGRWIGLLLARGAGARRLFALAGELSGAELRIPDLLTAAVETGQRVRVLYVYGLWHNAEEAEPALAGRHD